MDSARGVLTPSLFQLVSTDDHGIALPFPAELGPLPLYPQSDGFYSVLGPPISHVIYEAEVNGPTNDPHTLAYSDNPILAPPRGNIFCGSPKCSGNSGPHTCSHDSYTCTAPACGRSRSFKTRHGLNRHYNSIHLIQRIDCPVPGCENIGGKGIKRYDNLVAHMRNKHGVSPAGGLRGE